MATQAAQAVQTIGNKGSDVYATAGDPRVDLSVKSVRNAPALEIRSGIAAILGLGTQEALEDAYVMAFHTRNVRGGKGERDLFAAMFEELHAQDKELAEELMDLIPHYGCWDDMYRMLAENAGLKNKVIDLTVKQLREDRSVIDSSEEKGISLCAKWAPRETKMPVFAQEIATKLFPTLNLHSAKMRAYRKYVSLLNARVKPVETYMCDNRWQEIKPETVPGRAGKIYNRAFLNLASTYGNKRPGNILRLPEDEERMLCRKHFEEHYAKAARGEAKVHGADTLFPHEVVKKASLGEHLTEEEKNHLRGVWRSMVEKARSLGGLGKSIMMSDFSGSMQMSSAGDTPYWVSMAIGILGAEVCADDFKEKLMTFDSTPKWHTLNKDDDIIKHVDGIIKSRVGQGTSTDFQAAMDLVLKTLKEKRVKPGQEPENLIVLTDMNWDQASSSSDYGVYTGNRYRHHVKTESWQTHVEMIRESFKRAGEDMWGTPWAMPRIVIWNLSASAKTDFHAKADTPGVVMLSGWSPTQFEVLMKEGPRQITPYEMLRLELDDAKYDKVRERIRAHQASLTSTEATPTKLTAGVSV